VVVVRATDRLKSNIAVDPDNNDVFAFDSYTHKYYNSDGIGWRNP
jgi:hypothetical protein